MPTTTKDSLELKRRDARYRARLLGFAALGCCLLAAGPAAAQDDEDDELVYVYGRSLESTLPQELAAYGSDLVSLGREELEEKRYVDPQQMLQMEVPGLHLTSAGPFSYNYVSIQGSRLARYGASDVLWLVDGVRLNNRLYPSTNPDTLPGNMVERIEVLKGGESLYYGTSAAGGVLNIVSRDFSDTFGGDVSVATDSNDSYTLSGMVRGPAGPGNYAFFASQDESDGYEIWSPAEPSATDRDQSYDVTNVGFKYGLDISDDLRFVAQLQHTDARIDQVAPVGTYAAYNERDEEIVSLRFDYAPADGTQFFVKAYYHDWDSLYTDLTNDPGDPNAPPSGDIDVPWGYEDKGFNAAAKFRPADAYELLVGYDYQGYNAVDDYWMIDPITEKAQAVFAQIRTSEDRIENGAVAFGVRYNDADAASATVWNLSGKYYFGEELYFQGGASTNFVLPSAEQLFLNDPFCNLCGNPDLNPEESTNFNAGIGSALGRRYWQATVFRRDIENIIDYDFSQPAYPDGRFENMGEATIEGFEILGGVALSDRITLDASYVNNDVELEGTDRQMDYNPRWHAKASISYDGDRFGGSLGARFVSNVSSSQSGFGRVDHGDYTVADLSAYLYVDPERRNQVALRLENAFDEIYPALRGFRPASFDDGSGDFLSMLLGPPRTLHLSYRHSF
jgi:vitamin B12 transporter